jgi:hypothetical protein
VIFEVLTLSPIFVVVLNKKNILKIKASFKSVLGLLLAREKNFKDFISSVSKAI